jgi:hypothetical protein
MLATNGSSHNENSMQPVAVYQPILSELVYSPSIMIPLNTQVDLSDIMLAADWQVPTGDK